MKSLVVYLFCLFVIKYSSSDRIFIRTADDFDYGRNYQIFPLRTDHLKFSVKARNDIFICLTNELECAGDPYVVSLGRGGNTHSGIFKGTNMMVQHDGAIINVNGFATYWVTINKTEGTISAGRDANAAIMSYTDPNFIEMENFAISTGYGSPGEWYFDSGMISDSC